MLNLPISHICLSQVYIVDLVMNNSESSCVRTLDTEGVWSERERRTTLTTTDGEAWASIDFSWNICFSEVRGSSLGFRGLPGVWGRDFVTLPDNICITLRETSLIYSGYLC